MLPFEPTYSLPSIKAAISEGRYAITRRAGGDAAALGLDETDVRDCVLRLEGADFYKSMLSRTVPGSHQDVYKCSYESIPIYTKVRMGDEGVAVIISFKRDDSASDAMDRS